MVSPFPFGAAKCTLRGDTYIIKGRSTNIASRPAIHYVNNWRQDDLVSRLSVLSQAYHYDLSDGFYAKQNTSLINYSAWHLWDERHVH